MNKDELKNIVSEILGNSDDSTFSRFIEKIASSLEGNQALKLNGIGHFQIKKEPLSRMERKMEGSISEKEILLFLPEGESNEESIISFEIDEHPETSNEFSESVFDVSINKPTIISEPDSENSDDDSSSDDEILLNKITEFIESGEVIEGYELLDGTQSATIPIVENENINSEEASIDDMIIETNDNDFTEAEINKEFMNDDLDDDLDDEIDEDDEYDIASSSVEAEIPEDDVNTSEAEIKKTDIETEIDAEFTETNEDETNPFDELDNYIKDETKDEAQEIIDAEPEESIEELRSNSQSTTDSEDEKSNKVKKPKADEWYKNPILYIATISLIAAIVVVYIFMPTSTDTTIKDVSNSFEISNTNNNDQLDLVDSIAVSDSVNKNSTSEITKEQTADEKLAEIKKNDEVPPVVEENVTEEEASKPKINDTPTGLYRDIKNDKSITNRIYFDGERYTVQASSWRSTTIAEREVNKLKKRGFDAFIYKVFIASKNGTWNRVRIGYFNTQKEAEQFLKKNKI